MRLAAAQRLRALRNAADLHTYRGPQPQCQQPAVHRDRAHSRVFATSLGISRSSASSTWRSREPWTDEDWSRASRGSESAVKDRPWSPEDARKLVGRRRSGSQDLLAMQLILGGREVAVVPMWVAVQQCHGQPMQVYRALQALSDANLAAVAAAGDLQKWGTSAPTSLLPADHQLGSWHNYLVGVEGIVGECSIDSLWPNRVLHGSRTAHNLRDSLDVVNFLSHPDKDDVLQHLWNLQRLQQDHNHRPGWCCQKLVQRYGQQAVSSMGLTSINCDFDSLNTPSRAPSSS